MIEMPGRHLPADRSAGDESTLGGYMAIHKRPAAFDGADGMPYSADIAIDETGDTSDTSDTGDATRRFGAYLLFLQWRRLGPPGVDAHLETDYLVYGETADEARAAIGAMSLHDVKAHLDAALHDRLADGGRRWYDAMREEQGDA